MENANKQQHNTRREFLQLGTLGLGGLLLAGSLKASEAGSNVDGTAVLVGLSWMDPPMQSPWVPHWICLDFVVVEPKQRRGVEHSLTYFFENRKAFETLKRRCPLAPTPPGFQFRSIQDTTERLTRDVRLMGVDTDGMELEDLVSVLETLTKQRTPVKFNTKEEGFAIAGHFQLLPVDEVFIPRQPA